MHWMTQWCVGMLFSFLFLTHCFIIIFMKKRKVQVVICVKELGIPQFLLLQMNAKRNSYWQNVTGSVEDDESFQEAAMRESQEETGIEDKNILTFSELEISFNFIDQWKNDVLEKVYLLECKNKWDVSIDPNEHQQFKWITLNELNSNIVHYSSNFEAIKCAIKYL